MARRKSPSYPLRKHATGQWFVRFRGKNLYYGRDRETAAREYAEDLPLMMRGEDPRTESRLLRHAARQAHGLKLYDLIEAFLDAKRQQVDLGELTLQTWGDYRKICVKLARFFGPDLPVATLGPDDFQRLLGSWQAYSPKTRANQVNRTKVVFHYAWQAGLIETPVRFGPLFKRPAFRSQRQYDRKIGARTFTAEEIRTLLEAADPTMKAMIYLGINAGYEPHDCGRMQRSDWVPGQTWLTANRWKTEVARRCPLWPETTAALDAARSVRPAPAREEWATHFFLSSRGHSLWKETFQPVSSLFEKLLRQTGLKRPRMGFLWLRHTLATVGGEMVDPVAIQVITGHADHSMLAGYTHGVSDARLLAITDHVRRWLRGEEKQTE